MKVVDCHRGGPSAPPGEAAAQVVDRINVGRPGGQPGRLGQDPPGSVSSVEGGYDGVKCLAERPVGGYERGKHVEYRNQVRGAVPSVGRQGTHGVLLAASYLTGDDVEKVDGDASRFGRPTDHRPRTSR